MARVVVGTDGSEAADEAVRFAAIEARSLGATLSVIHAWPEPDAVSPGLVGRPRAVNESPAYGEAANCTERAVQLAEAAAPGVTVEGEPRAGDPTMVLVDAAVDAELLVVGSRGRGDLSSLVLGSVSHACLRRASGPVAVVRQAGSGGRVVAATDGSERGTRAVLYAAAAAARHQAPLAIIHAWHVPIPVGVGPMAMPAPLPDGAAARAAADAVIEAAIATASSAEPDLAVAGRAAEGPTEDIVDAAAAEARMIVVGSGRTGDIGSIILGSTCHHLVRHASCPVVCVP
jgi:nucleotide-binding universal stress UspA family protein